MLCNFYRLGMKFMYFFHLFKALLTFSVHHNLGFTLTFLINGEAHSSIWGNKVHPQPPHLNNYFDFHVCLSFRLLRASVCLSKNYLQFLQKYNKMLLIKVVWYVLRVKNMYPRSPSGPSGTAVAEAKPRCVYLILKPHGQSFITSPESVQSSCVH